MQLPLHDDYCCWSTVPCSSLPLAAPSQSTKPEPPAAHSFFFFLRSPNLGARFAASTPRLPSDHRWLLPRIATSCSLAELCSTYKKRYLGASGSNKWWWRWPPAAAMEHGGAGPAPDQRRPLPSPDGELVELMWRDGGVVARAQAHHQRAFGGNTGASGVTEEAAWLPDGGGSLGGDMYSRLWRSIAQVGGDAGAPSRPPAMSGHSAAGSSFCGSNLVAPAPAPAPCVNDDLDDAAPPAPGAGASTSGGSGSSARRKRSADELDSRSEDADFEAVDETPPGRRPASKRRARAAEVHNMSERRRRDRINEKMRALQELVPHCNKTDKASILDEAIEYLKSLQLQVQIMWMASGMAPMMLPGAHQLMPPMAMNLNSPCVPPVAQAMTQMQRVPPLMSSQSPDQMPSAATNTPNAPNRVRSHGAAVPRNPFLHPTDALTTTAQVQSLFGYGPQVAQYNEKLELMMVGNGGPAFAPELPSSSDGART